MTLTHWITQRRDTAGDAWLTETRKRGESTPTRQERRAHARLVMWDTLLRLTRH